MSRSLHHRAFAVAVGWTLLLLFLGSVVHATGSSLACPDWPTCHGTLMPNMIGGVFWEHLHRLVAGGLVLLWLLATWLAWKPGADRPWLRWWSLVGVGLLIVQSVLGGVTVLMKLPPAVSTAHLGLAFLFLSLTTVLAVRTSPRWGERGDVDRRARRSLRPLLLGVTGLVYVQSLLGALVRHTGAALACPGVPLCLGQWVPPLDQTPIALQYFHRVVAMLVALAVLGAAWAVLRRSQTTRMRRAALGAVGLVLLQVTLGFVAVATFLAVLPDALHTLVAASLLAVMVSLSTWSWEPDDERRDAPPTRNWSHRAQAAPGR